MCLSLNIFILYLYLAIAKSNLKWSSFMFQSGSSLIQTLRMRDGIWNIGHMEEIVKSFTKLYIF